MMANVKQVIIIRKDLGMRRGKEIAQGAHASMEWLRRRLISGFAGDKEMVYFTDISPVTNDNFAQPELVWLAGEYRKVVCQVESEAELLALHKAAQEAELEAHLITDLGATEFHGVPTVTALAIGPDFDVKIDPLTKRLRLY